MRETNESAAAERRQLQTGIAAAIFGIVLLGGLLSGARASETHSPPARPQPPAPCSTQAAPPDKNFSQAAVSIQPPRLVNPAEDGSVRSSALNGTTAVLAKSKSCSGVHSADRSGGVTRFWCR